jgi:hypothetical protein
MMPATPLRFFWILVRPSLSSVALVVGVIAWAVALAAVDPLNVDAAIAVALFVQAMMASTGYRHNLLRGYFDPILVNRTDRLPVAVAHWTISIAPGAALWIGLGIVELLVGTPGWPTPFTPAGIAAFLYLSTAVWVISLWLPRYAGGALWLVAIFVLASMHHLTSLRAVFLNAGAGWAATVYATGAALVLPVLMVDQVPFDRRVMLMLVATSILWTVGTTIVCRMDGVLTDPS